MTVTSCLAQLVDAMHARRFVQLRRRDPGHSRGFVLDIGPELVLLAFVNQYRFEGFDALRISDVRDVEPDTDAKFTMAVLNGRGHAIPAKPSISMSSVDQFLLSAGELFPLTTIYCDPQDAQDCTVGRVVSADRSHLTLKEIDSDGAWRGTTQYQIDDVWRIHFGGEYEDALYVIGGEPGGTPPRFGRS